MQFNLPRIACNVVLTILAFLVTFFNPQLAPPFITLLSIMCTLSVDPSMYRVASGLSKLPRCLSIGGLTMCARHLYVIQRTPLLAGSHESRPPAQCEDPSNQIPVSPTITTTHVYSKCPVLRCCWIAGVSNHARLGNMGTYSTAICVMCIWRLLTALYFFWIFLTKGKVLGGSYKLGPAEWIGMYYYLLMLFWLIFATGSLTYAATLPYDTCAPLYFQFAISHLNIGEVLLHDNPYSHSII